jgi:16S rRNA U516 pseudouridylate synthase RsuA-like enzyme
MATKKPKLAGLVDKSMEGRELPGGAEAPSNPDQSRERFKPRPKQAVVIRLDEGDYRILQRIAERKGTKAEALIRQSVKEMIRNEGGGSSLGGQKYGKRPPYFWPPGSVLLATGYRTFGHRSRKNGFVILCITTIY